jgi:hypothetical protein
LETARGQKDKGRTHWDLKMTEREGEDLNMTDMENWWAGRWRGELPQGLERLTNEKWVAFVKADIPKSDFTWEQYQYHVKAGFGDEWFFDQDRPPGPEWGEGDRPPGKSGTK